MITKGTRILIALFMICIIIIMMVSCAEKPEKKILGSWYDEDMNEMFFSEGGIWTTGNKSAEYVVDGDRITLRSPEGETVTFWIREANDSIYLEFEEHGDYYYFYRYEEASKYHEMKLEEKARRREEQEQKNAVTRDRIYDYLIGTWTTYDAMWHNDYVFEVNADGTYALNDSNDWYSQDGEWYFEDNGKDKNTYVFGFTWISDRGKEITHEEEFYLPDWEDRDLSEIMIRFSDTAKFKKE